MQSPSLCQLVEECIAAGSFAEAYRHLSSSQRRQDKNIPDLWKILEAELQLELGELADAKRAAENIRSEIP